MKQSKRNRVGSILTGLGYLLGAFCTPKSPVASKSGTQKDYEALRSDWETVGDAMRQSIEKYSEYVRSPKPGVNSGSNSGKKKG